MGCGARASPTFKDVLTVLFLTAIAMPLPSPHFPALLTPPCQAAQIQNKQKSEQGHRRTALSAVCSGFLIGHPLPLL